VSRVSRGSLALFHVSCRASRPAGSICAARHMKQARLPHLTLRYVTASRLMPGAEGHLYYSCSSSQIAIQHLHFYTIITSNTSKFTSPVIEINRFTRASQEIVITINSNKAFNWQTNKVKFLVIPSQQVYGVVAKLPHTLFYRLGFSWSSWMLLQTK
jgi:hypothetical protein